MANQKIEELKAKNPIFEVARSLGLKVPNKQSGTVPIKCLFHEPDNHPSMVLMSDVNYFKCMACGSEGDVIDLVKKVKNLDFKEAVLWLDSNFSFKDNNIDPEQYLRVSRGITTETQAKFGIRCEKNKIVIPLKTGEKYRWLSGDSRFSQKKGTKAELFKTSDTSNFVILAEGELDAILTWQKTGYPIWTGTAGVETFKNEWIQEFENIKRIYIAFDADNAGDIGASNASTRLGRKRCFRLRPTEGKDWTEYFVDHKKTKEDFDELLKNAEIVPESKDKDASTSEVKWPEPLSSRAFYGLTGEFVRVVEPNTEADPAALVLNFLVAFGSIIGDSAHIKIGAKVHPMRLFGVLTGRTAKGRKGESWGYPKAIFIKIDEVWGRKISSGLSSGEGLIWAVRDEISKKEPIKKRGSNEIQGYQDVIVDEGIKDKRLLVVESEFASVLRMVGRDGNVLSAIIRDAWDSGDLQVLVKTIPTKATRAHISILGHITKEELLKYLTDIEAGNGFGNRFMWFCVKRSKTLAFGGQLSDDELELLVLKVKDVVNFAKQIKEIKWAEETKPLWEKIYPTISEGQLGMVGVMTSRADTYVTRLACIYACLDKSNLIRPPHLLAALAVWDYAESSVRYLFQDKIGDPIAEKILEELKTKDKGMSRTDINIFLGGNIDSGKIVAALDMLISLGKARRDIIPTNGRKKEQWFAVNKELNPSNSFNSYLDILEQYIKENNISIDFDYSKGNETNELDEQSNQEEFGEIVSEDSNTKPLHCRTCNGTEFWQRPNGGGWECPKCHPQISDKKIAEVETK